LELHDFTPPRWSRTRPSWCRYCTTDVSTITSRIRGVARELVFAFAELREPVLAQLGEEQRLRRPGKLGCYSGRQTTELVQFHRSRKPELGGGGVGSAQESIDLHRHCSHVVHYDLAWNPATLEQRTGRIDRIGSRTQRLRQLNAVPATDKGEARTDARLEVNAPYLAGTYDERMFEELRLRAQTLEVLLGGDLAGSSTQSAALSDESSNPADGEPVELEGESRAHGLVALPDSMADSLRVDLAVWPPSQPMTVTSD
jgi:hypothetical protein